MAYHRVHERILITRNSYHDIFDQRQSKNTYFSILEAYVLNVRSGRILDWLIKRFYLSKLINIKAVFLHAFACRKRLEGFPCMITSNSSHPRHASSSTSTQIARLQSCCTEACHMQNITSNAANCCTSFNAPCCSMCPVWQFRLSVVVRWCVMVTSLRTSPLFSFFPSLHPVSAARCPISPTNLRTRC